MPRYRNIEERLIANSIVSGELAFEGSWCWLWIGSINPINGYPRLNVVRRGRHTSVYAHRLAHEAFIGPIPAGFDVDHGCKVRACINPAHLKAKTIYENRYMNENNVVRKRAGASTFHDGDAVKAAGHVGV